ncbi:MAG: septum formation protein Maf [Kofleriaceae bacterium]|nr:septum formation protein Maf [Kofleriaceae bacterium]
MSHSLILASESKYRRELLDRLALPYQAEAHRCDERAVPKSKRLEQQALDLARAKASSLAAQFPNSYILASDQIAELEGTILHKPGSVQKAEQQLAMLSGRTHRLLTAVALLSPGGEFTSALDTHSMTMRSLTSTEIQQYVDADMPLDCCGSYKIECLGISLFESISGEDFTAIVGLPLLSVCQLLRNAGFAIPAIQHSGA